MGFYTGKKVLVTGGTGLIGRPLVEMLVKDGAEVDVASLDDPSRAPAGCRFKRADLRAFDQCLAVCRGMEIVFQLAGVKGSPAVTVKQPASFFVPIITVSINMMEAARQVGVERYLYTSSIGVYAPADVLHEDDVWRTFPSPHDRISGWAKRMGELQADAYNIQFGWDKVSIVRPANVYGPYDNFDPANAMVIPSLIARAVGGERPLTVWGDGSPIRDFIHARDVARGMMLVVEQGFNRPVNLGSGTGVPIRKIAETVAGLMNVDLVWDITKPAGDARRLMNTARAESIGFQPQISLEDGIAETMAWYRAHRGAADLRYNALTDKTYAAT